MNEISVKLENVSYMYPDKYLALEDMNLTIYKGEAIGLVGSNGAGKSTLLSQLTGLKYPTKGRIEINSKELNKKNLAEIRKEIGFVFQNTEDQLFTTSIYEDVAFAPKNYKLSKEEVEERVKEVLDKVGIYDLKDRAPYRLSGGQRNMAAIATAISMNPSLLIMDEPTAALDPKARRRIIKLLNSFDCTKIIASHDLDMILDTCSRTIVLNQGKIVADGSTKEILLDKEIMESSNLELPLSCQPRVFV